MLFNFKIDESILEECHGEFGKIYAQKIEMHISTFDVLHIDGIIVLLQGKAQLRQKGLTILNKPSHSLFNRVKDRWSDELSREMVDEEGEVSELMFMNKFIHVEALKPVTDAGL